MERKKKGKRAIVTVGHQMIKMDPAKVKGVTSWPVPTM